MEHTEISIDDARRYVKRELKKYPKQKEIAIRPFNYFPSPSNDLVKTDGNNRQLENAICRKIDAERYCTFIEDRLDRLSEKEKEILVDHYILGRTDYGISIDVELTYPRTYYRHKNNAIMRFYKYLLLKGVI